MPTEVAPFEFLQLIAEPIRWRLLDELGRSDRRVGELCELVDKPQSLVSYHLRELRAGGLVTARRSAADGRDTYYQADVARCEALLAAAGAALHPSVRLERSKERPRRRGRGRKPRVLFLCTGNSARSQMAEALIEHRSAGAIVARSAGSHPKPLHAHAVRALAERGIDISDRRSKHFDEIGAHGRYDRVITLCDKVREVCPDFPGHPITAHWSIADPAAGGGFPAFARAADEIERRVERLIDEITSTTTNNERKRS